MATRKKKSIKNKDAKPISLYIKQFYISDVSAHRKSDLIAKSGRVSVSIGSGSVSLIDEDGLAKAIKFEYQLQVDGFATLEKSPKDEIMAFSINMNAVGLFEDENNKEISIERIPHNEVVEAYKLLYSLAMNKARSYIADIGYDINLVIGVSSEFIYSKIKEKLETDSTATATQ